MAAVHSNIKCSVCGENQFEEREGFYYCLECGTKHEQVQQVEVETGDAFNDTAGTRQHTKTLKINVVKVEKPKITSWECYNYILRGYVEELLSFGAKEELKLMALQVWAAYLRHMEVAFFNKKQSDLPKLGVRYLKNDAQTIYNNVKAVHKSRKRKREGDETSCTSGGEEMSARNWRRSKRKLDESLYSSMTSGSSTTGNSNRAIKITYNTKARKILKKRMPAKHLLRHEKDTEGVLQCHFQPRVAELRRLDHQVMVMSLKQIYAVLAIALNLIGDEIQLTDLLRYIKEGHLGWTNVLQYFPENIAGNGKDILKSIEFYRYPEKHNERFFRNHVSLLSKAIGIQKFKTPNIIALVQRYVTELCLPQDIRTYAERLINFLPPRFDIRTVGYYPAYEARAMAYIIFVLKLLFGLDDHKEQRMSKAANKLNHTIQQCNRNNAENRPLLFVWDEWVQYIEMRKVIVSYFNRTFCKQFKQCESTTQILEQMSDDIDKREEQDIAHLEPAKEKLDNFKAIFEAFLENYKKKNQLPDTTCPLIKFKTTNTPGLTYFNQIRMHCANNTDSTFKIPDFMRTDHSERDMQSYLKVKPLIEYFRNKGKELKVNSLDTTENRHCIGMFRTPRCSTRRVPHKACFDITEQKWADTLAETSVTNTECLEWKTDFEPLGNQTLANQTRRMKRNKAAAEEMEHNSDAGITICDRTRITETREIFTRNNKIVNDAQSGRSIEIFSENNMDPLESGAVPLKPRRDLGKFDIFLGIEDEDSLISNESVGNDDHSTRDASPSHDPTVTTARINIKSEFITETSNQDRDEEPLKFYISNMDCWQIFGHIAGLSGPQRDQLLDKLPSNFSWLVETCAQTLDVDWSIVYEQLMVIEMMFCVGIENLDDVKDCVYLNYVSPLKEYNAVLTANREIW